MIGSTNLNVQEIFHWIRNKKEKENYFEVSLLENIKFCSNSRIDILNERIQ
jgi:hypothetical protein